MEIAETIPDGVSYDTDRVFRSTKDIWLELINSAKTRIQISSFYWTLTTVEDKAGVLNEKFKGMDEGKKIFDALVDAKLKRNVEINIVQNTPNNNHICQDTTNLKANGIANVRSLHLPRFLGSGLLHTKFIIADDDAFYLGSANMDWRALSHVKELGILVRNCSSLANDLERIFQVYWYLSAPNAIMPLSWPPQYSALFNMHSPMKILANDEENGFMFFGSSPPKFSTMGRTTDLQAIKHVMSAAKRFIYINVMSYRPLRMYTRPQRYWAAIDTAIRAAALERKLEVRILVAKWDQFRDIQPQFIISLMALTGCYKGVKVVAKEYMVPADAEQQKIPFARVSHSKFMVTDNGLYIGTSNWIGNYFIDTAGVGLVVEGNTQARTDVEEIFVRDWNSVYSSPIQYCNETLYETTPMDYLI